MNKPWPILALCLALSACQEPTTAPAPTKGLSSVQALNGQAPASRELNLQAWHTQEGARVLYMPAPELAMVDIRLTFAAGSSQDGAKPGVALLTNAMLNEGTHNLDVTAIAEGFENLGAEFSNGSYRDMAIVGLRTLSEASLREPALAHLLTLLQTPAFPEPSLARIKNQLLMGFDYQKQNPAKLGQLAFFAALYGDHPYAHPSDGTPGSISTITPDDLRAFYQRTYTAANAVIAIVGDVTQEQAQAMAQAVSASLPKGPRLSTIAAPEKPSAVRQHIEFASNQTHILIGQLGIERNHPDYAALYLGNQIFGGGGFGSRLMEEVREKRGLTYGVYSGFTPMQVQGPFSISLQTRADQTQGTLELIKTLLAEFLANGPTEQELNNAKRELSGSFPLSTASNESIVGQLGSMGFYDLPLDWLQAFVNDVNALTADEVKAAMQRHLSIDQLTVITVGPTVEQVPLPAPTPNAQPTVSMPEH